MSQIPVKDRYPFRKWTAGRTDIPDMDGYQDCRSVCLQDMIPCRPRKFSLAGQTYLIEGVFSRIIILIFPGRNFPEVSKG